MTLPHVPAVSIAGSRVRFGGMFQRTTVTLFLPVGSAAEEAAKKSLIEQGSAAICVDGVVKDARCVFYTQTPINPRGEQVEFERESRWDILPPTD